MPVHPVEHALEPGAAQVLADGEGVDVAEAADVEIAAGGVMDGVRAPPVGVGHQGEDAEDAADQVVHLLGAEEGAVPAVVLQHEEPHDHHGGRHRDEEGQPVADAQAPDRGEPEHGQQEGGGGQLEPALPRHRLAVGGEHGVPVNSLLGRLGHRGVRWRQFGHDIPRGPGGGPIRNIQFPCLGPYWARSVARSVAEATARLVSLKCGRWILPRSRFLDTAWELWTTPTASRVCILWGCETVSMCTSSGRHGTGSR